MKPSFLIEKLDDAVPGFRRYVESEENCFERDRIHGLFAACSHFVSERPMTAEALQRLAAFVNRVIGGPDEELENAACTCFLENLAAPGHPIRTLLSADALRYWDRYE